MASSAVHSVSTFSFCCALETTTVVVVVVMSVVAAGAIFPTVPLVPDSWFLVPLVPPVVGLNCRTDQGEVIKKIKNKNPQKKTPNLSMRNGFFKMRMLVWAEAVYMFAVKLRRAHYH